MADPAAGSSAAAASAAPAAPAAELDARLDSLSGRLICRCGCGNKVVQRCYCGTADALREEIRAQLLVGSSDEQVLSHLVGKYGEQILASPAPRGFNLAAWAAPSAALLAGVALAMLLLWRWGRRTRAEGAASAGSSPPPAGDPYEKAFEAEYASRQD